MADNQYIATAFPPHDVSPKEKSDKKKWGLPNFQAAWYHNEGTAPPLFFSQRDTYLTYMKYAFGLQDPEKYKPALHVNPKNQTHSFIGGIRWQIKNFATKRVQATISKVFNRGYDPVASAIDPSATDRREQMRSQVKTWMENAEWLAERQEMLGVDTMPPGMDMDSLPINDEDLSLFIQNDFKLIDEINLELGIQYHLARLDFDSIKEKIDQYLTILPVAGVWCGLDSDLMPVAKVLNPGRVVAPRSELNNFKRIGYAGYIDEYTVAEFKKLVGTEFGHDELKRIISNHARKGNYIHTRYNTDYLDINRDVDTIQVMHLEIPTVDEYVFLDHYSSAGNRRFVEKPWDYYRSADKMESFRTKYAGQPREIVRVPKNTVYGGYWVVGSDIVFGWGEKNYCKGELGYKLQASNMLNGMSSCLLQQMIPCLDNLETHDKKIQALVASAIPRVIKIDLFALRKASFKMNGKDMTTEDLLTMFFQTGVIVTDTSDMQGSGGDTRKPIEVFEAGSSQEITKYLALMQAELEQLDEIIGYNRVSSGAEVSPEMGKSVAKNQIDATDVNLDHLYRSDRALVKEVFKSMGHLHRLSVQAIPEKYVPIIGEHAVARLLASPSYDDVGIDIEARPTQMEWDVFYLEINDLVKAGKIEPEDRVQLRRFKSLKQAQSYLRVLTRKRNQARLQEQVMLIDKNAEAQQTSNEQTSQNAKALEQMKQETVVLKANLDAEQKARDHAYSMEEIALQIQLQNIGQQAKAETEGDYRIQAVRARPKATA